MNKNEDDSAYDVNDKRLVDSPSSFLLKKGIAAKRIIKPRNTSKLFLGIIATVQKKYFFFNNLPLANIVHLPLP